MNKAVTRQIQSTRQRILFELKRSGGLTCQQLAEILGITSMGVRRHLITLERDGLVYYKTRQYGPGRPSYVYYLTELAEEMFPRTYGQLTNELLSYIELLDGEVKIQSLFDQRAQRRIRHAETRLRGLSFPHKVMELARILEDDGYLAEAVQIDQDTFILREHNCAIHQVAARFQQACASELSFLRAVLPEAEVEREHHMVSGETYCGYRITLRQEKPQ